MNSWHAANRSHADNARHHLYISHVPAICFKLIARFRVSISTDTYVSRLASSKKIRDERILSASGAKVKQLNMRSKSCPSPGTMTEQLLLGKSLATEIWSNRLDRLDRRDLLYHLIRGVRLNHSVQRIETVCGGFHKQLTLTRRHRR